MTSRTEAERLHQALDDFAGSVPATPIDVDAIQQAARKRRARRRVASITAGCGLLLAPLAFLATVGGSERTTVSPATTAPHETVRVVAPGERVTVAPNLTMWLTKDGKQCLQHSFEPTPWCNKLSGGKTGANLAGLDEGDHRAWLSGGYVGDGDPAGVRIRTLSGTTQGTVVTLAGNPGWGAWYSQSPITKPEPGNGEHPKALVRNVTVYDSAGKTIVSTDAPHAADAIKSRIDGAGETEARLR